MEGKGNQVPVTTEKPDECIAWIDVETSGVSPERDALLEVGAVVTSMTGDVWGDPISIMFNTPDLSRVIEESDEHVQNLHTNSGLWLDVWRGPTHSVQAAETILVDWLESTSGGCTAIYVGGNSITLDRNFIRLYLPRFYSLLSYRSVDVTSLALALRANMEMPRFVKERNHRALSDVYDSIDEFSFYMSRLGTV